MDLWRVSIESLLFFGLLSSLFLELPLSFSLLLLLTLLSFVSESLDLGGLGSFLGFPLGLLVCKALFVLGLSCFLFDALLLKAFLEDTFLFETFLLKTLKLFLAGSFLL